MGAIRVALAAVALVHGRGVERKFEWKRLVDWMEPAMRKKVLGSRVDLEKCLCE